MTAEARASQPREIGVLASLLLCNVQAPNVFNVRSSPTSPVTIHAVFVPLARIC